MSENPLISVIIRTWNEEQYLDKVLSILKRQTYQNFETIIVDDHSTDKTLEIAKEYNCRVVSIPDGLFSHPYSCNLGARNAKGEYLVYLNGHSIPTSTHYLQNGLKNFKNPEVAGVFSYPIAHKGGTMADMFVNIPGYTVGMLKFEVKHFFPACLATVNAIIRKDLWDEYNFDENYNNGWGGEDLDWALHHLGKGYVAIHDPSFKTRHSHNLKAKDLPFHMVNGIKMAKRNAHPKKQIRNF